MASESRVVDEKQVESGRKVEATKIINELLTDPHITQEKVMNIYDTWADTYDTDINFVDNYNGPSIGTELVLRTVKDKDAKLLDLASGTGALGQMLKENGYTNIDALDGSAPMLEKAKQKNIYINHICAFLGQNRSSIEDDTYDAVVTSGSFGPGHLNHECFAELIRIVKPGGHICIVMEEEYLTTTPFCEGFQAAIEKNKKDGCWEIVERRQGPIFAYNCPSTIFTFKILDTKTHPQ